jgi:outer membrane biosynthesis protein TonB
MGYNAQLVVRSRDLEGTSIIEKVKELAGDEGKTYSEMALELLERGLGHEPKSDAQQEPEPDPVSEPEPEPEPVSEPEPEPEPEPVSEPEPEPEPEPVSEPEPEPVIDLDPALTEGLDTVDDVAQACLEQLEEKGAQGASRLLAHFFASAGPVEGGKVKNRLKDQLTKAEYDVILSKLRETKEYRNYRQRVIFER